jgi:hypothetical protein
LFLERLIKSYVEEDARPHTPTDWFVTCFSKEKDDLSQWRAYSGGENGYAIAFLAGAFFGRGSRVVRVNYERDQHLSIAAQMAEATLQFFREGFETRSGDEHAAWADEFLLEWSRLTNQLAPMVKDPAFRGENEYRIVHEFQMHEMSHLRFKQRQSLLALHLPITFPPPNSATHSSLLPIVEVMVGPGRHKEISRVSVDVLLRQKGYYNIPVSVSTIPFQTT